MEEKEWALLKVGGLARTDSKNFHKIMVMKTVVWEQGQTNCSKEQNKSPE